MSIEDQLRTAFHAADAYEPSRDLFARVQRTLEEDRTHRRRVRRGVLAGVGAVSASALWLAMTAALHPGVGVPGWSLEILTTAVLVAVVIALVPALRRFGHPLVTEVTGSDAAARRFVRLLESAVFLLAGGYVLTTARIGPALLTPVDAAAVGHAVSRLAGLLLLLGALHTLTILVLPAIRLVLADLRWREIVAPTRAARTSAAPVARRADRVATAISVLVALVPVGAGLLALFVLLTLGLR